MIVKQLNVIIWLLLVLVIPVLAGCASATKVFIPEQIRALPEGYARIVVTREKQLAGKYTPVYIIDIGDQLESNAQMAVRVGEWIKEPGLSLWYAPEMFNSYSPGLLMTIPSSKFKFSESGLSLDALFQQNLNAVIYVDYLSCNPDELATLHCGDGKTDCHNELVDELISQNGNILNKLGDEYSSAKTRPVQVTGKILGGDTLIWDRKPGLMRIGALWGAFSGIENIIEITPGNIVVEAGKTYYLNYQISLGDKTWKGDRWTITGLE